MTAGQSPVENLWIRCHLAGGVSRVTDRHPPGRCEPSCRRHVGDRLTTPKQRFFHNDIVILERLQPFLFQGVTVNVEPIINSYKLAITTVTKSL